METQKVELKKNEIEFCPYPWSVRTPRKKSPWLRRYQFYISNWYINGKDFTSTTAWKHKQFNSFSKKFEIDKIEFCPYPECPYPEKRNHPGFVDISHTWKSYNGKVFTSTSYSMETQKFECFSRKFEIVFWLVPKSWNLLSFVNISPTIVIDTSMERFSRVLQYGNPKIWFFKKN